MDSLIEGIFLSDFMIFIIICALLMMVTSWAFRLNEFAGYLLGWLVGIFCIVVYSAVVGGNSVNPTVEEVAEVSTLQLSFFAVAFASMFGLIFGFSASFFARISGGTTIKQARSITIALLTALLVISLYVFATSDEYTRKVMGIFELAFAIGVLTNYVLGGGSPVRRSYPTGVDGQPMAQSGADDGQSNFDRLRRRIRRD
jgi:hypothetical protein